MRRRRRRALAGIWVMMTLLASPLAVPAERPPVLRVVIWAVEANHRVGTFRITGLLENVGREFIIPTLTVRIYPDGDDLLLGRDTHWPVGLDGLWPRQRATFQIVTRFTPVPGAAPRVRYRVDTNEPAEIMEALR